MTPCMGIVLHMLNIRLFPEQLTYIANHAQDKVIFVDDSLVPAAREGRADVRDGRALRDRGRRRRRLAAERAALRGPDRRAGGRLRVPGARRAPAAGLCYTSGTTGNPKGVLYSHRSNVLHCLGTGLSDMIGVTASDRVLPVVPMFHVNAWGLPYACAMVGADLVMPGRFLQGEPLAKLIEDEKVTVAGAVPTIWMDLLRYADEKKPDLSSMRTVVCGGAAVPESLMRAFEERHGVKIMQGWGMTETSPLGAVALPARRRRGRGALGLPAHDRPHHSARRGAPDGRRRRGARGTASRRARSRSAVPGSPPTTTRIRPAPTSSTTAGCAPGTSPRWTHAGSCRSPTAPRT